MGIVTRSSDGDKIKHPSGKSRKISAKSIDFANSVDKDKIRREAATSHLSLIVVPVLILLVIGLFMVLSASSVVGIRYEENPFYLFRNQVLFVFLGLVAGLFCGMMPVRTRFFTWIAGTVYLLTVALQLIIFIVPSLSKTVGGNTNWIVLGGFRIQPAEFLKWGLVVVLAVLLGSDRFEINKWSNLIFPGVVMGIALIPVVAAGDFGTGIIFVAIIASMLIVAGLPWRYFAILVSSGLVAAALLVLATPSRRRRVLQYLGMADHDTTVQYQPIRGRYALGSGGLSGVGFGASREKWSYLPAASNDYIFAIFGEEFGLLGTLVIVGLFLVFGYGVYRLSRIQTNKTVALLVVGMGSWIIFQAIVNMAVVVGIAPVIGVPLPFVSAGGSAIVACLSAVGILVACVRSDPSHKRISRLTARQARRTSSVVAQGGSRNGR